MILLGLRQMVLMEENPFGTDALNLDWFDEEVSLADIDLVDNALEGVVRGAVPAWVIVAPAWVIMGVALFPVSPVFVSIVSGLFVLVLASRLFAVVVLMYGTGAFVCFLRVCCFFVRGFPFLDRFNRGFQFHFVLCLVYVCA